MSDVNLVLAAATAAAVAKTLGGEILTERNDGNIAGVFWEKDALLYIYTAMPYKEMLRHQLRVKLADDSAMEANEVVLTVARNYADEHMLIGNFTLGGDEDEQYLRAEAAWLAEDLHVADFAETCMYLQQEFSTVAVDIIKAQKELV